MAKLFIISAPSGAGKTTLVEAVLKRIGPHHSIQRVITCTTRAPRSGERDGYDFHYLTVSTFKSRIDEGFFLEWSNAHINYYGTPRSILEDIAQGKSYILVADRVGAEKIRAQTDKAVLIWITVPSMETLKQRLFKRGTENEAQRAQRFMRAQQEIDLEKENPIYDYHVLNDNLELAICNLEQILCAHMNEKSVPEAQIAGCECRTMQHA